MLNRHIQILIAWISHLESVNHHHHQLDHSLPIVAEVILVQLDDFHRQEATKLTQGLDLLFGFLRIHHQPTQKDFQTLKIKLIAEHLKHSGQGLHSNADF